MPKWAEFDEPSLAKGFTTLPNIVWCLPLTAGEKLYLMALLRYAWQDEEAFPSKERLAQTCSCSKRAADSYQLGLVEKRIISVIERPGRTSLIRFHALSTLHPNPCKICTPRITLADSAPQGVQRLHPSPAEFAPYNDSGTNTQGKGLTSSRDAQARTRPGRKPRILTPDQNGNKQAAMAHYLQALKKHSGLSEPPFAGGQAAKFFSDRLKRGDDLADFTDSIDLFFRARVREHGSGNFSHYQSAYTGLLKQVCEERDAKERT